MSVVIDWEAEYIVLLQRLYPRSWKDELFKLELRALARQAKATATTNISNKPAPRLGRVKKGKDRETLLPTRRNRISGRVRR